jgi:hypothetical protein
MGKTELQQVIRLLPRLSASEKRMVLGRLGSVSAQPVKSLDDWLLPGIDAELRRRGLNHRPLSTATISRLAPNYFAESTQVRQHLEKQLKRSVPLKHAQLVSLGNVLARALADYRSPVTPLGIKFMLQNVGNIPEAVEQSFPGYMAAGMLHCLVRSS